MVGGLEGLAHRQGLGERRGQRRVGPRVAQMGHGGRRDLRPAPQGGDGVLPHGFDTGGQVRVGAWLQQRLDSGLARGGLVGQAHAVGRQHAGEGMDQHPPHGELVGDETGVLAAGAAKALQGEVGGVLAPIQGHALDGRGHVGDGDRQEALGHVTRIAADLGGEGGEFPGDRLGIERLVAAGAEDGGEVGRHDLAAHDVGVGDGQGAAPTVGGRARIGAGAVGTHPKS
jgi:hypothetical protein